MSFRLNAALLVAKALAAGAMQKLGLCAAAKTAHGAGGAGLKGRAE